MRRPVLTLATFVGFAVVSLLIFRAVGVFSNGKGVTVSFDRGQFVQNVALGFLPVTFALVICVITIRKREVFANLLPFLCLLAACLAVPTMVITQSSTTSAIDFSMKTASLYLVAAAPIFAVASAWLLAHRGRLRPLFVFGLVLVCLGLVNSGAYILQHAFARVLGRTVGAQSVSLDHYRALEFVARQPARLILLDQFSMNNLVVNPAVMLGGKRVLAWSAGEEMGFRQSPVARENKALWLAWCNSDFEDESLGARLAEWADLLIAIPRVQSASWSLVARFGEVAVYRSTLRSGSAMASECAPKGTSTAETGACLSLLDPVDPK
jgi:hypothetical protein